MIRLTLHSGKLLFLVASSVVAVRSDDDVTGTVVHTLRGVWHVSEAAEAVAYDVAYAIGGASP
jgi:uncharacterized membrane protein